MVIIYDLRVEWMEYIWGDRDVARNVQGHGHHIRFKGERYLGDDDYTIRGWKIFGATMIQKMTAVWTSR